MLICFRVKGCTQQPLFYGAHQHVIEVSGIAASSEAYA